MPLPPIRPMRSPARRSKLRNRLSGLLVLAAPMGLAACGGTSTASQFPPPCPQIRILPQGGDLHLWNGRGHDITDQVLDGQVKGMGGGCSPGGALATNVKMSVNFSFNRGPAAPGRVADVPWFVAVARGDQILDRQTYNLRLVFPPNTDQLDIASNPITLKLPTSPQVSAAAYTVWVSFQLTPGEMAENRANPRP